MTDTQSSTHTPGLIEIYDEATDRSVRARPAFIVNACNSHNDLLDALQRIAELAASTAESTFVRLDASADIARAAIEKAADGS